MGLEYLLDIKKGDVAPDDDGTAMEVMQRIASAKQHYETVYHPMQERLWLLYVGDHYAASRLSGQTAQEVSGKRKRVPLVFNEFRTAVNQGAAIMTDNRPKWLVTGVTPDDVGVAYLHGLILDARWDHWKMQKKQWNSVVLGSIFGSVHWKVTWDHHAWNPSRKRGDVCVSVVDPMTLFADPLASDEHEPRWIQQALLSTTHELRRRFDVDGNKFRQNARELDPVVEDSELFDYHLSGRGDTEVSKDQASVTAWEVWYLDDDSPVGVSFMVIARNKIIGMGHSPYKSPGYPYVKVDNNPVPGRYIAAGQEDAIDLQHEINAKKNQILKNERAFGDIWLLVPKGADYEKDKTIPGAKALRFDPNYPPPTRMAMPQFSGEIYASLEETKQRFDRYMSMTPISFGLPPKGIPSASGLAQLYEAAQAPFRARVRAQEVGLGEVGSLALSRIGQFGKDQEERVYIDPEEMESVQQLVQLGAMPGKAGIPRPAFVRFKDLFRKDVLAYDVKVQAGSTLPASRGERFTQALSLFQSQAIDRQALLDSAEFPGREKIVMRMKVAEMEAAEMQRQAEADQAAKETQNVGPLGAVAPPVQMGG